MDLGLKGKAAVVLASTSGLGLAVARALLVEGAQVAVSGRDPARLERARAALAGHGERLWCAALDVTEHAALAAHVAEAARRFGRPIQILVTNAGGPTPATALEVDNERLQRAFELTLRSAIHAIQCVLPGMRAAKWGRIVVSEVRSRSSFLTIPPWLCGPQGARGIVKKLLRLRTSLSAPGPSR